MFSSDGPVRNGEMEHFLEGRFLGSVFCPFHEKILSEVYRLISKRVFLSGFFCLLEALLGRS
jgi:hypothetical protein